MSKNDLNLGFRRKRADTKKVSEQASKEIEKIEPPQLQVTSHEARKPTSSALRKASRGERISVYLTPEHAEYLRIEAARGKRSMSDLVSEALEMHRKAQG